MLTRHALGRRIARARKRAGLTQEQLATALGLERTAITRIELGAQGLDTLQLTAIAETLGCSPMVFFELEDEGSVEVLLRAPEAGRSDVQRWLQWLESLIRDYEALRNIAPGRPVR